MPYQSYSNGRVELYFLYTVLENFHFMNRMTERLEKQQKLEVEKKKRAKHLEFINALLLHGREFREFHRSIQGRIQKTNKVVMNYHANYDKERRKEEERLERERLRMLMVSGYFSWDTL